MASHAQSFGGIDLPRPGRAALPFACARPRRARPRSRSAAPDRRRARRGLLRARRAVRAERARAELRAIRAQRRPADRRVGRTASERSDVVRWRALELVDPATRQGLAREVDRTLRRIDPARFRRRRRCGAVWRARHRGAAAAARQRMLDGRPVTARGVLLLAPAPARPGQSSLRRRRRRSAAVRSHACSWTLEP